MFTFRTYINIYITTRMMSCFVFVLIVSYDRIMQPQSSANINPKSIKGESIQLPEVLLLVFFIVLANRLVCLCLQEFSNSFLEFKVHNSDLKAFKYFSLVQSWHTPVTGEKGWALASIFQLIVYGTFSFFNSKCMGKSRGVPYICQLLIRTFLEVNKKV